MNALAPNEKAMSASAPWPHSARRRRVSSKAAKKRRHDAQCTNEYEGGQKRHHHDRKSLPLQVRPQSLTSEQRRRGLYVLALDLLHDLDQLGVGRGGHADVVAAVGDVAVHELD